MALLQRIEKLEARRGGSRLRLSTYEARRILGEVTNGELAAAVIDEREAFADRLEEHRLTAEEQAGMQRLGAIVPDPETYLLRLARRDGR